MAITATVRSTDRTGVEMEALTAVSVAALTLYDMIKAVDPAARIDDIRVLRKEGGKTGTWTTMTRSGRVVIASTRAAAGVYEDRCGPIIVDWLNQRGHRRTRTRRGRRRRRRRSRRCSPRSAKTSTW